MPKFGVVKNVFDSSELSDLLSMFQSLPKQANDHHSQDQIKAYTNGIDTKHIFYNWLVSKVKQKIESATGIGCDIHVAMYLQEFLPWGVHSDFVKGDAIPGYAFLIPLDWTGPADSKTHTIIFNESYEGLQTKQYLYSLSSKTPNAAYLSETLCSHCDYNLLERLTLGLAAPWHAGDVIYWHRTLLHSSDNFLQSNISQKTAIVIFSTMSVTHHS